LLGGVALIATACSGTKPSAPATPTAASAAHYRVKVSQEDILSFLALNNDQLPDGYVLVGARYDPTLPEYKVDYYSSEARTVLSGIMESLPNVQAASNSLTNLASSFDEQGYFVAGISGVDGFTVSQTDANGSLFAAQFRSGNLIGGVALVSADPEYDGSSTVLTAAQAVYSRMAASLKVGDQLTIPDPAGLLTELMGVQSHLTALQKAIANQISGESVDIGSASLDVVADCEPLRSDQYVTYWMVVAQACDQGLAAVGSVLNGDLSGAQNLAAASVKAMSDDILPPLQDFVSH
jgi:hypothetical protein